MQIKSNNSHFFPRRHQAELFMRGNDFFAPLINQPMERGREMKFAIIKTQDFQLVVKTRHIFLWTPGDSLNNIRDSSIQEEINGSRFIISRCSEKERGNWFLRIWSEIWYIASQTEREKKVSPRDDFVPFRKWVAKCNQVVSEFCILIRCSIPHHAWLRLPHASVYGICVSKYGWWRRRMEGRINGWQTKMRKEAARSSRNGWASHQHRAYLHQLSCVYS